MNGDLPSYEELSLLRNQLTEQRDALLAACMDAEQLCKEMCKGGYNPEHKRIGKICEVAIALCKPKEESKVI